MNKPEKVEKVEIVFEKEPILADLDFERLLDDFNKHHRRQKLAEADAARSEIEKKTVSAEIQEAMKIVGADIVVGARVKGKPFRTTLVSFKDTEELNEDKLRENLMKIAKLDIVLIEKIWKASLDKVPAKSSYIKVTAE